jgi:endonuclease YncB( thermonuclease family)
VISIDVGVGDRRTPETLTGATFPGRPYGLQIEVSLTPGVGGQRVQVEIDRVDRDTRRLTTIGLHEHHVSLAMIEAGLAEVSRGPEAGHPYQQTYQAAEEAAQAARKVMWVRGTGRIPPDPLQARRRQ